MRTLKKTLALVLVVAMVLSFGVIGASADFTDTKGNAYQEEIEVLSAIGVINGMTNTTFEPDGSLTRAQAAKIIAFLKLGATNAQLISSASAQRFDDVPTSHWAAGYIEYCANLGVINGVGDNKFDPEAKLTSAAFTKMLLVAVGYDADENNFVGTGWAINVASKAVDAKIFDDGIAISDVKIITRAEAARLSYLALFYSPKGTETKYAVVDTANGDKVVSTWDNFFEAYLVADKNTNYAIVTTTVAKDSLSETVFKLTKSTGTDKFGRPANTYTDEKGDVDLTYAKDPTFTYTATITSSALTKALKNYTFASTVDTNYDTVAEIVAASGNGIVVEIYTDGKAITQVVVIVPEFVQVTVRDVKATKSRGAYTEYAVTLSSSAISGKVFSTVVDEDKDKDTAFITGSVVNEEMVLAYKDTKGNLYIEELDTMTGALTSVSTKGILTIDGQTYEKAAAGTAVTANKNDQIFYVDSYGYIVAATDSLTSGDQFAYVIDAYKYATLNGTKVEEHDYALLAFADGTVEEVQVAAAATKGQAVSYTISAKGVYTLTNKSSDSRVTTTATGITTNKSTMTGSVALLNNNTLFVFVNYDAEGKPTGSATVYTGISKVPNVSATAGQIVSVDTSKTADGIADVVYINVEANYVSSSYIYVLGSYATSLEGYVYDVIIDGQEDTITVSQNNLTAKTLYSSITDNGSVTTAVAASDGTEYAKFQYKGGLLFTDGTLNATYNTIGADVPIYMIDTEDDSVVTLNASSVTTAVEGDIYLGVSGTTVVAVYVVYDSTSES